MKSLQIVKYFRVFSGTATPITVKSIEFARRGSNFLINGSDRVIRVYDIDDLMKAVEGDTDKEVEVEALQRLQDNVNRTQWRKCIFSGQSVYLQIIVLNINGNLYNYLIITIFLQEMVIIYALVHTDNMSCIYGTNQQAIL